MPPAADPDSASVDTLTCGACRKDFALADIVKFIQHKVLTCNKENNPCKSKSASAAANESDGESNNNSADSSARKRKAACVDAATNTVIITGKHRVASISSTYLLQMGHRLKNLEKPLYINTTGTRPSSGGNG